jgi:hypothetical protein
MQLRQVRRPLIIVLVAVLQISCVHQARLYDVSSGNIPVASFKGSGHGPIWLGGRSLQSAPCKGEYSTVADGDVSWGQIYSGAGVASATVASISAGQRGSAIARCDDGTVYQCEYVASGWTGGGTGACQNNHGRRYRLMF